MKYTVDWCEAKSGTSAASGKAYTITKMSLTAEDGKKYENVSTFDNVKSGDTIEGEIIQKGQYLNFQPVAKANSFGGGQVAKTQAIEKLQEKKAEQIGKAQDRSQAMWAKHGACELVAHHPAYKGLDASDIPSTISKLASQILNDMLEPF